MFLWIVDIAINGSNIVVILSFVVRKEMFRMVEKIINV